MARVKSYRNSKRFRIESFEDGVMTVSAPQSFKNYTNKQGVKVILTTSGRKASAFMKRRLVSEIVAQGLIQSVADGKISIATIQSPIVSKDAQRIAVAQKSPVKITTLK